MEWLVFAVARISPLGEKATSMALSLTSFSRNVGSDSVKSQRHKLPAPVHQASQRLSGEKASERTYLLGKLLSSRSPARSQSLSKRFQLAVAKVLPSGEKATRLLKLWDLRSEEHTSEL